MTLNADRGGSGARLLVLLHGLGATRDVWRPFIPVVQTHWDGAWLAPDLRGHGQSAFGGNYSLGCHSADVADLIQESGHVDEMVVLGHSMGGVIGLALASGWFGVIPSAVFGLGIKVAWTDEEVAHLSKMARAHPRIFETRQAALERYMKTSGLLGVIPDASPLASAGVVEVGSGWRLAQDPATASVGPPPMRGLIDAAQCPLHLACGKSDQMVTREQLERFDPDAAIVPGGHNAMVEHPAAIWGWMKDKLT